MLIVLADSRTSRRTIPYNTGPGSASARSVDIANQPASGTWVTFGVSAYSTGTGVWAFSTIQGGIVGSTNATQRGIVGAANTIQEAIVGLVFTISQPASASLAASGQPLSIQVEVPVQSTADDAPKAVSNDDLDRALEAARTRGRALVTKLFGGKDMLTTDEFGKLIGVTRHTVNQKRKRQEILALEGAGRGLRFPKWQIGKNGKPFRALPELFDRLGGNPWSVYRFLVQHHPELNDLTGVEALQRGQVEQVIDAAESTMRAAS